jgi:hypothetical protein
VSFVDVFLVFVYCLELAGVIGVTVWIAYKFLEFIENDRKGDK